jgi:glycosyltransferase involved in cell wall biosynthesis
MNNQPLVSVIIPTYNRAHLIGETLDSVLAQTYTNWECIIVDDGSSDNTDEFVGKYVKKDSRFKYYHRPEEHLPGGNGARNYGFKIGVLPNTFMVHDREERQKSQIELYSDAYFKIRDRSFKKKYGNLNDYDKSRILNHRKKIKLQLIKARIRQNQKSIKGLKKCLRLIDCIIPEIEQSVEKNKVQQPNYLSV